MIVDIYRFYNQARGQVSTRSISFNSTLIKGENMTEDFTHMQTFKHILGEKHDNLHEWKSNVVRSGETATAARASGRFLFYRRATTSH